MIELAGGALLVLLVVVRVIACYYESKTYRAEIMERIVSENR